MQNLSWMLDRLSDAAGATTEIIDLSPGNDAGTWKQLVNLRLLEDGTYSFWKTRGGSRLQVQAGADIVTAYGFEARVSGVFVKYVALQLTNGSIYLYNINTSTLSSAIITGMNTSDPVTYNVIGQFLYVFSYNTASGQRKYKVHNLSTSVTTDWNNNTTKPISAYSWLTGSIVTPNIWNHDSTDTYVPPFESKSVFRAYAIVDILDDGSVSIPGRPIVVETLVSSIVSETSSRVGVALTMPIKQAGVFRRVLVATRWQETAILSTTPSTEGYPNSPYFIVGDIKDTAASGTMILRDYTPDASLIRPITELVPLVGGVPVIYAPNQFRPITATSLKGSLIIGGFEQARQLPVPYTDAVNPSNGNVFVNVGSGTDTSYRPAFVFEYSDGTTSGIVESESSVRYKAYSFTAGVKQKYEIEVTAVSFPNAKEITTISIEFDGQSVETTTIKSGDTENTVASKIRIALGDSAYIMSRWNVSVATDTVTIEAKNIGTEYSVGSPLISVTGDAGDSTVSITSSQITAGANPTEGNFSTVQIHGTNALVTSVYILAKNVSTSVFYLVSREGQNSGFMHGCPFPVKHDNTSFGNLPVFQSPGSAASSLSFRNNIALCIPAQNPRIDVQTPIVDTSTIQGIVPMQFDEDKTTLRYRVVVLTDRNVQVGYLTEIQTQPLSIFSAQLEIINPSISALYSNSQERILNSVVFQSNAGISMVTGSDTKLLVDKDRYPIANTRLASIAYNKKHDEIWMFFRNQTTVLVFDTKTGLIREYVYPSNQLIKYGLWTNEKMYIANGTNLLLTDLEGVSTDDTVALATITIDENTGWTYGTQSSPLTISDGTTTISITTINDGGIDTIETIASEIAYRVNESEAFKCVAIQRDNKVSFVTKVAATTATLTFSPEPKILGLNGSYQLSVGSSSEATIQASALSGYLTRITERMKLLELSVYGQYIDASAEIDLQTSRRESITAPWVKTFTAGYTGASQTLSMSGKSWQIHKRGIKPRILLKFNNSADGYIEDIRLKVEVNENTGRARL
jgi:hypothetical protein